MRSLFGTVTILVLGSFAQAVAGGPPPQIVLTAPGDVYIHGYSDRDTSAVVSAVALQLVRDTTLTNKPTTYWKIQYNYYSGAYRWESAQELYIDFVDSAGTTLVHPHAITISTPSEKCRYGRGVNPTSKGQIDFDFTKHPGLSLTVSGNTTAGGRPGENHKC